MTLRSLILAFVFVPWFAVVAEADQKPQGAPTAVPSADAKKQATAHFERGRSAYNFGNYDVAISEYQAAFELTGAPELVFNIAQTYRTKGDKLRALEAYKKYVALDPTGAGVVSAQQHIEALENELRAEAEAAKRAVAEAAAEAETAKRAAASAAEAARREAVQAAQRRVADAEAARSKATSRYLRIAGLAAGGTGVVTLGASAVFGWRARSLSRDASGTTGMWTEEAQREVDDAKSSERTMYILLGVGGAVALTGGVLYVIGARKTESAPPAGAKRISVAPLPGGAAVVLGGRF